MTDKQIDTIILEDLEYKKQYSANFGFDCNVCFDTVEEGEVFVFMGDKKRVCINCLDEIKGRFE